MPQLNAPKAILVAGALALLGTGGYTGYEHFHPQTVAAATISTADVQMGTITATVSATGNVATPAQSKLAFTSSGRLLQLLVNVGDQVAAGQPLAKIDDSE